jgi:hypothetical protein
MKCKWKYEIKYWPRDVQYGFTNLFRWLPVIWKDRNWDHVFIYKILRKKLDLQEKHIRKYGHHVDNEKDADKIRVCVLLLDRLLKDEYYDNVYRNFHKKWGHGEFRTEKVEGSDLYELHIDYESAKTKADIEQCNKEHRMLLNKENELRTQDINYLFKMMSKHIQSWWD